MGEVTKGLEGGLTNVELRASLRGRRKGGLYSGVHSASIPPVSLEPSDNGPYRNHIH